MVIQFQNIEEFVKFKQKLEKGIDLKSLNKTKSNYVNYYPGQNYSMKMIYETVINNTSINFNMLFHGQTGRFGYVDTQTSYAYGFIDLPSPWYSKCYFITTRTMTFECRNSIIYEIFEIGYSQKVIE